MDSRPPPNLTDPAELKAYRRELRGVARGWRFSGIALAVVGAALLVARSRHLIAVHVLVPILIVVVAIVLISVAILIRTTYHMRRLRGG